MTRPLSKLTLLTVMLLLLQACSNSSVIISPLYNRVDDRMRESFQKSASFSDDQIAEYAGLVANFHYWHRRSELPAYASLLNAIQRSIHTSGATTEKDVAEWMATTERFTQTLRECHPVNFMHNIIRSMSDEQISSVHTKWTTRRSEHRKRYEKMTREERIARREKNVKKWASRIGFNFTDRQSALLRDTLTKQISLRQQYFSLSDRWREELFEILADRRSPELENRLSQQLEKLWHLLESSHPTEWRENRALWAGFTHQLIGSLTSEQRSYLTLWIRKMGKTLSKISAEKVSKPALADNTGCSTLDGA